MQQELAGLAILIARLFNAQEMLIAQNQQQAAELEALKAPPVPPDPPSTPQPVEAVDPSPPPVVQ